MTAGLQLGRPGLYRHDVRAPAPLTGVRLDVAGFVGVALRGPVNTATPVVSWADYERRFGGFQTNVSGRDRLLPYAVQAFFAQGGARAWVVRVVAADDPPRVPTAADATARFVLPRAADWELTAADEGSWGSGLTIQLAFEVSERFGATLTDEDQVPLPTGVQIPAGSLLRVRRAADSFGELRWGREVVEPRTGRRLLSVDEPLTESADGDAISRTATVEVVTGTLIITDTTGADERVAGLGLAAEHPRYPPRALERESLLVRTAGTWTSAILPDLLLGRMELTRVQAGQDRSDAVDADSFFDDGPPVDDPLYEGPHRGADELGRVAEIGILCVPDLGWRALPIGIGVPAEPSRPPDRPRHRCDRCRPDRPVEVRQPEPPLDSWLSGRNDDDLRSIIERQRRTVAVAELRRRFVVLLDVPTGLPVGRIADWRAEFDSSYAGAFHPWLGVSRGTTTSDRTAILVPPSAFAAGIMAERERRLGLSRGPANQLALGAITAAEGVGEAEADLLHQQSINVFAAERDGFRLAAARTLSTDPDYRQLSIRRLMIMLSRTVEQHGQWLVFEPNTDELRSRLTDSLTWLLTDLHRQGAFSGATEEESFFVRCDESVNPAQSQLLGRLVAEIGVAPACPLEYLVLRIASDGDGGLVVDEAGRAGSPAESRELAGAGRV